MVWFFSRDTNHLLGVSRLLHSLNLENIQRIFEKEDGRSYILNFSISRFVSHFSFSEWLKNFKVSICQIWFWFEKKKRIFDLQICIQIISNVSQVSKFQEFQSRARILEFFIRFIVHEIAISMNARPNNDSNTWYSRMHLINSFWFVVAGFIQLAFDIISFVSLVSFYYRCRN